VVKRPVRTTYSRSGFALFDQGGASSPFRRKKRKSLIAPTVVAGYWLFHCHFLFHIVIGMNLVLHVGTHADLPPVPENFPRCGDFLPPVSLH